MKTHLHLLSLLCALLFSVNMSAQDDKWIIDCSSDDYPFGTVVDGSLFRSGNSSYTIGTVNIYSPKLDIQAGETLVINARRQSTYTTPTLKVYYSDDKENWTLHRDFSDIVTSTETDFTSTDLPTGIKYIRVELYSVYLYKFEGPTMFTADNDVDITLTAPVTGMVNSEMAFTSTLVNLGLARTANEYTVELVIDNEIVATDEPDAFDKHASISKTFLYTPHSAGTVTALVRYTCGEYVAESAAKEITIAEEVASGEVQVGTGDTYDMNVPFSFMYKKTHAETIYSATDLNLKAGDKITKIGFHGWASSARTVPVKIWVTNTEATQLSSTASISFANTDEMTLIYDGDATFAKAGSRSGSTYTYDDLVEFELAEPFIYTGNNLHFVYTKEENDNGGLRYETSTALKTTSPTAYTGANYTLGTTMTTVSSTPVIYITVANDPLAVSGTVTNKKSGAAIADAKVMLKSDNVEYYGTTDAEGKYSVSVIQTARTYTVTVEKDGFFPVTSTIDFSNGENLTKDIELIEAKDLFIQSVNIPTEGMINHDFEASIEVFNANATMFAAADYNVDFVFGGKTIAVDTQDIPANSTVTLTVKTTVAQRNIDVNAPRRTDATNQYPAHFVLSFGEETLETEQVEVNILEEQLEKEVAVGVANNTKNTVPVQLWYKASQSESLYPAAILTDIENGSKVMALTYRGESRETYTVNANITVWMENVDNGTLNAEGRDTEAMDKMFEGVITLTPTDNQELTITLDKPFVYTGGDIRIVMRHSSEEECNTYFESDNRYPALYKSDDTMEGMLSRDYLNSELPVCYMTIDNAATIYGKVTDCFDNDIEADIIVYSGDVTYKGQSAADGTYSIRVGRTDLTYSLSAQFEDYDYAFGEQPGIDFANGDVEHNIMFLTNPTYQVGALTTVCLPMSLDATATAAAGKFYELYYVDDANINFLKVDQVVECVPYLFEPAVERPFAGLFDFAAVKVGKQVSIDGVTFSGVLDRNIIANDGDNAATSYIFNDDTSLFQLVESEETVYPFHAYITCEDNVNGTSYQLWEEPNGIVTINTDATNADNAIYTLDGRRANNTPQRGIYIVNGKKTVIK